jgi:hypothetical protein
MYKKKSNLLMTLTEENTTIFKKMICVKKNDYIYYVQID